MYDRPEELVDFLVKHKLTGHQFLIAYLLYIDKIQQRGDDKPGGPSLAMKYNVLTRELGIDTFRDVDIDVLIQRGFIIDHNRSEPIREYYPDMFTITDSFIDAAFVSRGQFEEFWDAYPSMVKDFKNPNSGKVVMLKGVPSKDNFRNQYLSKITTKEEHDKIMKATIYGKEKGMINCRIDKYLESEFYNGIWDTMTEDARSGNSSSSDTNYQFVPRFDNKADE